MKPAAKRLCIAGLLAGFGLTAHAQMPPGGGPGPGPGTPGSPMMAHHHPYQMDQRRPDPARMKEFRAKRLAAFKERLKITSAQDAAWATWTAAMEPPTDLKRPDPADVVKMTAPERIDRMLALRTQRNAWQDKRAAATKTFYVSLSAEQQRIFDYESLRFMKRRGGHGGPQGAGPGGWR